MSRIRSVHPGLFTDEDFMPLSEAAQIFYVGLLVEADDQGVFEWKPLTLRARLRPTKDGSVEPLLSELVGADRIRAYEIDGRKIGAIRNFRKFQRPKSPNAIHSITDEIRNYVGLSPPISEIEGDDWHSLPRNGEIVPQMEEGGWRKKEEDPAPVGAGARANEPEQYDGHRRKRAKPGRRIDEDWRADEQDLEFARSKGISGQRLANEVDKFRDHHLRNGSVFADWHAAWRTWVRRAPEFARGAADPRSGHDRPRAGGVVAALGALRIEGEMEQ